MSEGQKSDAVRPTLTDDWVAYMSEPSNQHGLYWRLAGAGELPWGIEPTDPRVVVLCKLAKSQPKEEEQRC